MNPEISIIIPIYNTKDYLDECLQSISVQTFKDYEAVMVDDGSTDGSGEICDKWARKDSRFKVIHQQNAGVSSARNAGIDASQGEWLTFVDSDDWIYRDYLELLFENLRGADLCICGYQNNGLNVNSLPTIENKIISDIPEDDLLRLLENYSFFGPFCKLYNSEAVRKNKINFTKDLNYGEDLLFNIEYIKNIGYISVLNKKLYYYNYRNNSLSNRWIENYWSINSRQWIIIKEFINGIWNNGEKVNGWLYSRLVGIVYDSIVHVCRGTDTAKGKYKEIRSILKYDYLKDKLFRNALRRFDCSNWIKLCIRYNLSWILLLKMR